MSYIKYIVLGFIVAFLLMGAGGVYIYKRLHRPSVQTIAPREEISVTFIEGWTNKEYARMLEDKKVTTYKDYFLAIEEVKKNNQEFAKLLPARSDLLGFLFPDTYRFFKEVTPAEIVQKQLDTFLIRFESLGFDAQQKEFAIQGYPKVSLSLNEVVTLASIIERETAPNSGEEKKIVAGIFLNRLLIGQALESDATVNFATGKSDPTPTAKDLENNSPYNTYKNPGLPPGPIANPGLASIEAVLKPIKNDYYFFLHKQPSGEVIYSKTFEEHVRNKQRYLK